MAQKPTQRIRRRERKNIVSGVAHVNASFNTVVNITDVREMQYWSSAGTKGFKGSRKSTPRMLPQIAAEDAGRTQEHGMKST